MNKSQAEQNWRQVLRALFEKGSVSVSPAEYQVLAESLDVLVVKEEKNK